MNRGFAAGIIAMMLFAAGCGGGGLINGYGDDGTGDVTAVTEPAPEVVQGPQGQAGEDGADGADGTDGRDGASAALPSGVWLDGVNAITFFSTTEGLMMQAADTTAAGTLAGAFNGAGTGNKALLGLNAYDGLAVSDLQSISIVARQDRGSSFFYFNIQVDCDGDGAWTANDGIVVVDSDSLADFTLPADGSFSTITLDPADAVFKMVGGPKASCGNLPSHLGGFAGLPLTSMPATAVLWNGSTGDGGMPRATPMAALLFIMGDSVNQNFRAMTIQSIAVNADTYTFM
ncbi:MAG: hypothetical protein JXA24_06270 [Proteobacteria bacterium]|nr:hypothetical protein [Pseudomonadota bacterium]